MIIEVKMCDDSMVTGFRNGKQHARARNALWWQKVKFKEGKVMENEAKAVALCRAKWPNATSYSTDLKEANTPAPTYEYLQEVL